MAGKYGPSSCTFHLEDGPGGTSRAMTAFIRSGLSVKTISPQSVTTTLGDSFVKRTPIGIKDVADIQLTCLWDTTASTGSHDVFLAPDDGPQDDTREAIAVFGDGKTWTGDVRLVESEVVATLNDIQMINVTLSSSGGGVWS